MLLQLLNHPMCRKRNKKPHKILNPLKLQLSVVGMLLKILRLQMLGYMSRLMLMLELVRNRKPYGTVFCKCGEKTRDSNSLECHWGRLQGAINKFHGCYERAERLKKSGTTLEDVKRAALRLYQETNNNQAFKHEECWEICRKNAKWCTKHLIKQDASRKQKSVVDGSNETPPTSKQAQTEPSPVAGSSSARKNDGTNPKTVEAEKTNDEGVTRPDEGRKVVKDQKRRVVAEKVVADALGNFQSSLERQFELSRVDVEPKKEREKKDYELHEKNI